MRGCRAALARVLREGARHRSALLPPVQAGPADTLQAPFTFNPIGYMEVQRRLPASPLGR